MRSFYLLFFGYLLFSLSPAAGQDSLIFENGNSIKGEIKGMDRGILTIETDYSNSDFTIKWVEVKRVYTKTQFLITLTNGDRLVGTIAMDSAQAKIQTPDGSYEHPLVDIVTLKSIDTGFWDRVHASLSLGYSLTKAQTLQQITMRGNVRYITEYSATDFSYNNLTSTQDDADRVHRQDGGVNFNYFLPKDWYVPISTTVLSNTEQKIDLRFLTKAGIGKYLIHRNNVYWGFSTGITFNHEDFNDEKGVTTKHVQDTFALNNDIWWLLLKLGFCSCYLG